MFSTDQNKLKSLFLTKALYSIDNLPSVEASGCPYHEGTSNEDGSGVFDLVTVTTVKKVK
jgi:hypothetical protein